MILVLFGMLVGFVLDLGAIVASIAGLVVRKRWPAFLALGLALAAIVFNAFDWMVTLRGRDTRGEPITWRDDSELYWIVIAQACVLALAVVTAVSVSCTSRASRGARSRTPRGSRG